MELKKTVKFDGKFKGIRIIDGKVIDDDGVEIDLIGDLEKAYKGMKFDISTLAKSEESITVGLVD